LLFFFRTKKRIFFSWKKNIFLLLEEEDLLLKEEDLLPEEVSKIFYSDYLFGVLGVLRVLGVPSSLLHLKRRACW